MAMTFGDHNELELHLAHLAGVAGLIAKATFQEEGEESDVFRSACLLRQELEGLAAGFTVAEDCDR